MVLRWGRNERRVLKTERLRTLRGKPYQEREGPKEKAEQLEAASLALPHSWDRPSVFPTGSELLAQIEHWVSPKNYILFNIYFY